MKWEAVRLGDYCSKIGSGATPKGGSTVYKNKGVSFIRSQNVYNLTFTCNGLVHISDEAAEKLSGVTVEENDILLNITGDSVARICTVPREILPARVNQHVSIIRPSVKNINHKFLAYYLASPYMQAYMLNLAVGKGASRNALTKGMIEDFPVPLPPISIQIKIADILSAYDDLIENNQKQIKLLEEAAMRLYKEWFVDLRFPGYETTKIVDGMPEGWMNVRIKDMGKVITGKTPSTLLEGNYGGDIPFVKIPDMHNTVFPLKIETRLSAKGANTQRNKFLPPNSIMVSCIATVGLVCISHERCQTNQQINSIVLGDDQNLYFLFFKMKRIKSLLEGVGSSGATMTNVNKTKFENLNIVRPRKKLISHFNDLAEPYFKSIFALSKQNEELEKSRNKLLPKLMSGEIVV